MHTRFRIHFCFFLSIFLKITQTLFVLSIAIHTKNLLGSSKIKLKSRHSRCEHRENRNGEKKKKKNQISVLFSSKRNAIKFYGLNVIFLLCFGFEYLFTCDWYTAHTTGEENRAAAAAEAAAVAAAPEKKKKEFFNRKKIEESCNIDSVYVCSVWIEFSETMSERTQYQTKIFNEIVYLEN